MADDFDAAFNKAFGARPSFDDRWNDLFGTGNPDKAIEGFQKGHEPFQTGGPRDALDLTKTPAPTFGERQIGENRVEAEQRAAARPVDPTRLAGGGASFATIDEENNAGDDTTLGEAARSAGAGAISSVGMGIRGLGAGGAAVRRIVQRLGGEQNFTSFVNHWMQSAPALSIATAPVLAALSPTSTDALERAGGAVQDVSDAVNVSPERQQTPGNVVANAIGQVAGMIAISAVGGEGAVNADILGMSFDQIDQDLKDKGAKGTTSGDVATVIGGPVMGALERTGLDVIVEGVPLKIKNRLLRGLADVAMTGGFEAAEEVAQQIVNNFAVKLGVDPNTPVRDWAKDLGEGLGQNALGGFGAGAFWRAILGRWGAHGPARTEQEQLDTAPQAPQGIRESGALNANITPEDEASPLPTDLIAAGKMEMGAATATTEANHALRAAGMPDVGTKVTVQHNGKTRTGTVADSWTVDIGDKTSTGVKIRLDDGSMIEEPVETLRDLGVVIRPVAPEGLPEGDLADPEVAAAAAAGMANVNAAADARTAAEAGAAETALPEPEAGNRAEAASGAATGDFSRLYAITESIESGGRNVTNPESGAKGPMQTMPGTLKDPGFGVRAAKDDSEAELRRVGRDYLHAMVKRYGGNMQKAWAAYNWGPGHVDDAVRQHGADWLDHAPAETRKYVESAMAKLDSAGGVQTDMFTGEERFGSEIDAKQALDRAETDDSLDTGELVDFAHGWMNATRPEDSRYYEQKIGDALGVTLSNSAEAGGYVAEIFSRFGDREHGRGLSGPKIDDEFTAFGDHTGTLGIPRAEMPQIKAEHRGAMVNFLNARGINHEEVTLPAHEIKPTQAEFSPAKVEKAKNFEGGDRAILLSQENHVVDGHHQFVAAHDRGQDVRAIRLNAPIQHVLDQLKEMPSVETDAGAETHPAANAVISPEVRAAAEEEDKASRAFHGDKFDEGMSIVRRIDQINAAPKGPTSSTADQPARRLMADALNAKKEARTREAMIWLTAGRIAGLAGEKSIGRIHVAEALSYDPTFARRPEPAPLPNHVQEAAKPTTPKQRAMKAAQKKPSGGHIIRTFATREAASAWLSKEGRAQELLDGPDGPRTLTRYYVKPVKGRSGTEYAVFDQGSDRTIAGQERAPGTEAKPAASKQDAMKAKMQGKRETGSAFTAKKGQVRLRDWSGVEVPDVTEQGRRGDYDGGPTKDAFLKDGRDYFTAVHAVLSERGFKPLLDRKGKPGKAVWVNEGGVAVAGDVYLRLQREDGSGFLAQFGKAFTRGGGAQIRAVSQFQGKQDGPNRWLDATMNAADMADMLEKVADERRGRTEVDRQGGKMVTTPDHIRIGSRTFPFTTYEEASKAYRATIDRLGIGGSETPRALIEDANGKVVANISYNGRVWPGDVQDWQPGTKPLYSPPDAGMSDAAGPAIDSAPAAEENAPASPARSEEAIRQEGVSQQGAPSKPDVLTLDQLDQRIADKERGARPAGYGANNRLVTKERADEIRAKLRAKLNQLNSGIDPEALALGTELAVFHIEAGARKFADFARAVAADLGMRIADLKPFLRGWYLGAQAMIEDHGGDIDGMDGPGAVRAALAMIEDSGKEPARNADQVSAPQRPEGPEPAGVQPSEQGGRARGVGAGPAQRGERDLRAAHRGGGEAAERGREGSGAAEPGRGAGNRGGDGRPAGRASELAPRNHVIEPGSLEAERGLKTKARDNVRAIEIVKALRADDRFATPEEQEALARYVGWGGLKTVFPDVDGSFGKGFEDVGARLKELLSPEEYDTARRSIQYAHYTGEPVVRQMWRAVQRLGFAEGQVFEPGMGTGNFAGMMPDELRANGVDYQGVEFDGITASIAKALYPKYGVVQADYTAYEAGRDAYRLAIGNPPFSETTVKADPAYRSLNMVLHDYFFAKTLDAVQPGGLLAFVTSAGTLNKLDRTARDYLQERAWFAGAIRLPGDAFKQNANTQVTTDIIFLRKKLPGEANPEWAVPPQVWNSIVSQQFETADGGKMSGPVNRYFVDHPEMVLGEQGFFDKLFPGRYAVRRYTVRGKGDFAELLAEAVDRLPANIIGPMTGHIAAATAAADFDVGEAKNGSYYLKDGELFQKQGGIGRKVETKGKGSKAGLNAADQEKVRGLLPIRDHLRNVYAHDLAVAEGRGNAKAADAARRSLNAAYDEFVAKHGPINKGIFTRRRPNRVQLEAARRRAREDARAQGHEWDDGSFDPTPLFDGGASLAEVAKVRAEMRAGFEAEGQPWDEGTFSDDEVPDLVLEKRPNIDPFRQDPESYRLRSIEHYDDETGTARKGRVFFESVIGRDPEPQIKTATDALHHVLNKSGRVDLDQIADLLETSPADAAADLAGQIFLNPETSAWEHKVRYLSGNVRAKLERARAALKTDSRYQANVDALETVMPPELGKSDVKALLGSPWVPQQDVTDFAKTLGLEQFRATYQPRLATWAVSGDKHSAAATSTFGTARRSATELIGDALNGQTPKIYDIHRDDGKEIRVLNTVETQAANDKLSEIKQRFQEWIWADEDRANRLLKLYNEKFNSHVAPEYDGAYLTTPGVTADWTWRPHQKRAIARIVQDGNTYLAHAVGAGKTAEMIAATMEQRRLGLVSKPMIAVPNHMLGQFTKEFYELYPLAKLAIADEENFHTDRRKQFVSDIALNDLDAVVITHSAFGLIPISAEFERGFMRDQLSELRSILEELKAGDAERVTRRKVEQQIEQAEQRLRAVSTRRTDQTFTFEQLGVDQLMVDEAHLFRKLDFATRRGDIKGIDPNGSMRAMDLYMKSRYLETRRPGRSLVMASGTPITNTMAELFTISRFLQPDELRSRGIDRFDAWAGAFGDTVTDLEPTAAGTYKPQTRFAQFVNVPELSVMVRQVMDVITPAQLDQYVVRPKVNRELVNVPQTEGQKAYQALLAERMEKIEKRSGRPQKGDDIILTVIGDGRKSAIDMRLVEPSHHKEASKLEALIGNVFDTWKATKAHDFHEITPDGYGKVIATGPATQMVFSSLGVSDKLGFNVHRYIRDELVKRGVPADEIVLFNQIKSTVAKQKVFNDMNAGAVRVLIGSVDKMGTGVNAQRRLFANHNLDPEWLPSSDEQRNGRIVRQGNTNREVRIFDYATKGTYDSQMWGIMARKARFIEGFFRGDPTLRDMEDLGEASTYEQAKALTTKDPRILELTESKQELEKEIRRRSAYESEAATLKRRAKWAGIEAAAERSRLALEQADAAKVEDIKGDAFRAEIDGKTYDDRQAFQDALQARMSADTLKRGLNRIGRLGGFDLALLVQEGRFSIGQDGNNEAPRLVAKPVLMLAQDPDAAEARYAELHPTGTAQSAVAALQRIAGRPADTQRHLELLEKDVREFSEKSANRGAYPGEQKIADLKAKVAAIEAELQRDNAKGPPVKGQAGANLRAVKLGAAEIDGIRASLLDRLDRIGLKDRVTLEAGYGLNMRNPNWQAQYEPWFKIIKVALENARDPLHSLNHETFHALGPSGISLLTAEEYRAVVETAWAEPRLRSWVQQHYSDLDEADQKEEAGAEWFAEFQDLKTGRDQGSPAANLLARVAHRVATFLRALQKAVAFLRGKDPGITAFDVVQKVDSGEVGHRQPSIRGRVPTVRFGNRIIGQAGEAAPRRFGLAADETPLSAFSNTKHVQTELKAHPDYRAAKAGDWDAAIRLVRDLVPQTMLDEARSRFAGATFVPVFAEEASGDNAIPFALAAALAEHAGGHLEDRIVQSSRAYHTGAGAMDRLIARPLFDGPVEKGTRYVIVDDVTVMGATLAELANHIRAGGGEVAGTALLVNASRNPVLGANKLRNAAVERRFGDVVRQNLGVEPEALTGPESTYLLGFRDADSLRNRIAKAQGERDSRLHARGVQEEPAGRELEQAPLDRYIEARDRLDGDPDLENDTADLEEGGDAEAVGSDGEVQPIRGQAAPPPRPGEGVSFDEPIEKRWQSAREGIGTGSNWVQRFKLHTGYIATMFSRHWQDLPNVPKYADLQQQLRKLEAAPGAARDRAVRLLGQIVDGLTREDLDLFTRKVVLDDLIWESEQARDLPFGFTADSLTAAKADVDAAVERAPKIRDAVRRRKALNREIASELVGAGVLDAERLKNPAYYRHVVLDYARAEASRARMGGKKKLRSPRWARRLGSTMDINANYLEAEFDWLMKALVDIPTAKAIDWVGKSEHNLLPALREQAKSHNAEALERKLAEERKAFGDGGGPLAERVRSFRQRIAMGFKFIEDAIGSSHLDIPPQLEESFAALGKSRSGDPFPFLAWLLDNNHPGSSGAAVVLKAISERRLWTKETLGREFIDPMDAEELVHALAPDGYTTWSPDEGRLLFTVRTMPEHVVDAMLKKIDAAPGLSADEVRAMIEQTRQALAFGGMRYAMILPEEVASTLNQLRREDFHGLIDELMAWPLRQWKRWVLINPRRVLKYNLNNLSGDLDATIAGNPRVLRHIGRAARETALVMSGKGEPTARYEEAIERGVFDSGLSIQEIPDINRLSRFETLTTGASLRPDQRVFKAVRKAWNALQGTTQWRENVLRYAAYLDYAERLEAGESQQDIGYGASLPEMVDGVTDVRDRAALLARDLLGDYGAISVAGSQIRRKLIPFWSWVEINTKRYWRLTGNAFREGKMRGLATGGLLGAGIALRRTAWLALRMAMFYALVSLWNRWLFGDEEDELSDEQRQQLHLILGRDSDGEVRTLRLQGALSDALSWFGIGDAAKAVRDYQLGRGPWYDAFLATPKATLNRLVTGVTPLLSVPYEEISGTSLWPDIFETRFIRDKWRNLFETVSLEHEYDLLLQKPSRGYAESWLDSLIYTRDPGETAYNEARGITYDWLRRVKGQEGGGGFHSYRADALYEWRAARRFGDAAAEQKALDRLGELGVTKGDLEASIKRADPLGPIAKKDRKAFLSSLTDDELKTFQRADQWYRQRFLGEQQP